MQYNIKEIEGQQYEGKALILGGGLDQQLLVEEFNKRGYYTIIIDYYENPPAKDVAHKHYQVSTYDREAVLEIAKAEKVQFVTTISTDQPILVAAWVCEQLGLEFQITYQQALIITNKEFMKKKLVYNKIATAPYVIIKNIEDCQNIKKLKLPLIIKPVDSSGSRGVHVLNNYEEIYLLYPESIKYSQTNTIIAEEFIQGKEISVDCMVINSEAQVLAITDNISAVLYDDKKLITQSIYPSHIDKVTQSRVEKIVQQVAETFEIQNSPLFLQLIVNDKNPFLIEFSARIAGGSKPYTIPYFCDIDIVKEYVSQLLNLPVTLKIKPSPFWLSINYIYGRNGILRETIAANKLLNQNIIKKLILYKDNGTQIHKAKNTTERIGVFITEGKIRESITYKNNIVDDNLKFLDLNGLDIMIHSIYI
jgi:formate-dependent phosphoribosylglycinamide formyltransferase (GAR transformylase)